MKNIKEYRIKNWKHKKTKQAGSNENKLPQKRSTSEDLKE